VPDSASASGPCRFCCDRTGLRCLPERQGKTLGLFYGIVRNNEVKGGECRVINVYLIVGLGNPGSRYKDTRHNVGFQTIDLWCHGLGVRLCKRGFQSRNNWFRFQGKKVMLLCPLTFMNQSGQAVRACAGYYGFEPKDILVIHDDIDLPVGRVKMVRGSGSGGHKGVQSVIDHLGSTRFSRIKIGIGRPRYGEAIEDYVLAPFYRDERDTVRKVLLTATQACELFVSEGIEPAMNKTNCQNLAKKEESQ